MKSPFSPRFICALLLFLVMGMGGKSGVLYASGLHFSPEKIDMVTVFLGEPKYQNVRITNTSTTDVFLLDVGFTGDEKKEFRIVSVSPPEVIKAYGGYADVVVEFYPVSFGKRSVKLYMLGAEDADDNYRKYTYSITDVHAVAVLPEPKLECSFTEIDFGTVNVNTSTTASLVIRNVGTADATVTFSIADDAKNAFSMATATTVTIAAGDSTRVSLRFLPRKAGFFYANLLITMPAPYATTVKVNLYGKGLDYWELHYSTAALDFGTIATTADVQTRKLRIRNTGTLACWLDLQFPPGGVFVPDISIPSSLAVGEWVDIPISFRPLAEGAYEGTLILNSAAGIAPITLKGLFYKPTATVLIPDIKADTRQQIYVPVIVSEVVKLVNFPINACRIVLRFNASIFVPKMPFAVEVDSTFGGMRTLAFTLPINQPEQGDTLFFLQGLVALGDAESTPVEIVEVQWLNGGTSVPVQTATQDGRLLVGDIWRDQAGVRLVNPNAGRLTLQILPNPVHEQAVFQLSYSGHALLEIFDTMGRLVLSLTDKLPVSASTPTTIQADISPLPAGMYFCRLSSGNFSLVRTLHIE